MATVTSMPASGGSHGESFGQPVKAEMMVVEVMAVPAVVRIHAGLHSCSVQAVLVIGLLLAGEIA